MVNSNTAAAVATKTIAGHALTLTPGVTYIATRPWAERGRRVFPVRIEAKGRVRDEVIATVTVDGLTYDQANALINGFNDGDSCWDGRTW